jgi:hypothetical protein
MAKRPNRFMLGKSVAQEVRVPLRMRIPPIP